ncbi:MAG: ABC transporter ATP-binding protein/permease [Clostridiales bacterium]|nr:ABC transporter ATP-binding protein/permease [Clostridiales bacterium]
MRTKNKKSMFSTLRRLIGYILQKYKWQCLVVTVCILISTAANIRGTLFMKSLIDDYILPFVNQEEPPLFMLFRALLLMAAIYYIGVFCTWAYNYMMVYVSQGMLKTVRDDLFRHMERLPIRYFDAKSHGDIMSIYTNDTDTLRQVISQSFPQMVSAVITIVGVFISMLCLSRILTVITVIMMVCMVIATKKISAKSGYYFSRQQTDIGNVNGYIEEMMEGQKVVKVFCHEKACIREFGELNSRLRNSSNNANRYASILMPVLGNLGYVSYAAIAMAGACLSISGGGVTLGTLASFLQFSRSFNQPISQLSQQFNSIVMAIAGAERIFALLDEEPEKDEGYVELVNAKYDEAGNLCETPERTGIWAWKHYHKAYDTTTYQRLEGDIVLDHVDFGYAENKPVLHDIEIYARSGQKVALVGATGAGKTTITNLINRFYDVQDGKIRYDGININKIKKADLRRSLGIVLQDTHLFTGTVMENIRYGKPDATEEQVIRAAKLANAHEFILKLPDGYQTVLKNGGNSLSQGQRQLLAIARVAVANPPVLILDEATSSIDTRTEKIVQDGMDKLMEGRTVFVIAHRLSTIQNSDVIMVLDHGRIVERGNHESLLEKKGIYYQLYTGKLEHE